MQCVYVSKELHFKYYFDKRQASTAQEMVLVLTKSFRHVATFSAVDIFGRLTYLLTPWSRVLLEKLTSKLCR